MHIPFEIAFVLDRLTEKGHQAYLVGGAVRDRIMQRPNSDYDITSSASPDEVKAAFPEYTVLETGIRHGTVTVLMGDYPVEITAFRSESGYSDGRHPDKVTFVKSLKEDLGRRDFTVNAIAYNKKTGYHDPYGGIADINSRLIRCVGDPEERFNEDHLRILRAARFASTLGFAVEKETAIAMHKGCESVATVAKERIFSELCKLLCGENVKSVLTEFSDLIFTIIPELKWEYGFDQNNPNHCFTLYEHTVNTVSYVEPKLHLRLAMLLHDIAKPMCETRDEYGISHYKGHPEAGVTVAQTVLKRLKAPTALINTVCTLIRYHDIRYKATDRVAVKRLIGKVGIKTVRDILKLRKADTLSQSPRYYYRLDGLNKLSELVNELEGMDAAFTVRDLALSGRDIIALGVREGPQVGKILNETLEDVISDKVENEKFILISHIKKKYKL